MLFIILFSRAFVKHLFAGFKTKSIFITQKIRPGNGADEKSTDYFLQVCVAVPSLHLSLPHLEHQE